MDNNNNKVPLIFYLITAFFISSIKCLEVKYSDLSCTDDDRICDFVITNSVCVNGTCQCKDEDLLSGDKTKCLPQSDGFNGQCEDDIQCSAKLGSGGYCSMSQKCACQTGFHYQQKKCWKSVQLGEACLASEMCIAGYEYFGTECVNEACQCKTDYYEFYGTCRRKSKSGESCLLNSDCASGLCNSRICTTGDSGIEKLYKEVPYFYVQAQAKIECPDGSFPSFDGSKCLPELGSPCETDEECEPKDLNSQCVDKTCVCIFNIRVASSDNRNCLKVTESYNGTCSENSTCSLFGSKSYCNQADKKTCICSADSYFDMEVQACRTIRKLGEVCVSSNECLVPSKEYVDCINGKCSCISGTYPHSAPEDCRPTAQADGLCLYDEDCSYEHGKCSNGVCTCDEPYFVNNGACELGIGGGCSSKDDCWAVNFSDCIMDPMTNNSYCLCVDGFVASENKDMCLEVSDYGKKCRETGQCAFTLGENSSCGNETCVCLDGTQYVQGKCFLRRELGSSCKFRAECVGSNMEIDAYICQNAICACQYESVREGNLCSTKESIGTSLHFSSSIFAIVFVSAFTLFEII